MPAARRRRRRTRSRAPWTARATRVARSPRPPRRPFRLERSPVGALSAKDERVAGSAALALDARRPPKSRRWPLQLGAGIGELDRISQNGVVRSAAYAAAAMLVAGGSRGSQGARAVFCV